MNRLSLLITSLFLGYLLSGCIQKCWVEYQFLVPLSISPVKQEYKLGDTLWLEADFSDHVLDHLSQKYYTLENFDFELAISIIEIAFPGKYGQEQPGGYPKFHFQYDVGAIVDWSHPSRGFGNFVLVYEGGRYKFRTGIIPQDTGLYNLYIYYDTFAHREHFIEVTDQKCDEVMGFMRIQINEGNVNFDLLESNITLRPVRDDFTEWQDRQQTYSFYVRAK